MNSNSPKAASSRHAMSINTRAALGTPTFAIAAFAIAAGASAGAAGTSADQASSEAGKALVAEKCILCHDISIVTSRHASQDEWHEIINRMVMNGAQVTAAEVEEIANYLAKLSAAPQSASTRGRNERVADSLRRAPGSVPGMSQPDS